MNYFDNIRTPLMFALKDLLEQPSVHTLICKNITNEFAENYSPNDLQQLVERALNLVQSQINTTVGTSSIEPPSWYKDCESDFEEVAADMFMLWCAYGSKPSEKNIRQYSDLIIQAVQIDQRPRTTSELKAALHKALAYKRLSTVYYALNVSCTRPQKWDKWQSSLQSWLNPLRLPLRTWLKKRAYFDLQEYYEKLLLQSKQPIPGQPDSFYVARFILTSRYARYVWKEYEKLEQNFEGENIKAAVLYFRHILGTDKNTLC